MTKQPLKYALYTLLANCLQEFGYTSHVTDLLQKPVVALLADFIGDAQKTLTDTQRTSYTNNLYEILHRQLHVPLLVPLSSSPQYQTLFQKHAKDVRVVCNPNPNVSIGFCSEFLHLVELNSGF